MARRFSIGEAVGEPFRLAFGRPLATMVWGLISIVPSFIVFAAMGPMLAEMIETGGMAAAGAHPGMNDFESFDQFMIFQAWSNLSTLLSFLALLLVTTAIIPERARNLTSPGVDVKPAIDAMTAEWEQMKSFWN